MLCRGWSCQPEGRREAALKDQQCLGQVSARPAAVRRCVGSWGVAMALALAVARLVRLEVSRAEDSRNLAPRSERCSKEMLPIIDVLS